MAGLLNYFSYRTTMHRIVTERIPATGLADRAASSRRSFWGCSSATSGPCRRRAGTRARHRQRDHGHRRLDTDGGGSTAPSVNGSAAGARRMAGGRKEGGHRVVRERQSNRLRHSIENNFGLTIGYLALRYSNERVENSAHAAGRTAIVVVRIRDRGRAIVIRPARGHAAAGARYRRRRIAACRRPGARLRRRARARPGAAAVRGDDPRRGDRDRRLRARMPGAGL